VAVQVFDPGGGRGFFSFFSAGFVQPPHPLNRRGERAILGRPAQAPFLSNCEGDQRTRSARPWKEEGARGWEGGGRDAAEYWDVREAATQAARAMVRIGFAGIRVGGVAHQKLPR